MVSMLEPSSYFFLCKDRLLSDICQVKNDAM